MVVAEAGRLGTPSLLAIGDATGGLAVHLPAGAEPFVRGTTLEVVGPLAAPNGQLEIRPAKGDIRVTGTGSLPTPAAVASTGLAEAIEGRLATTIGRLATRPKKTSGGDITLMLDRDGATPVKVMADVSSRITTGSLKVGATYRVVGVVGQRASRSGALDGYRIWVRDAADLVVVAGPAPSPRASSTPGHGSASPTLGAGTGTAETVSIARARRITDRVVAIDAVVTAPATLLDATGRRIVVQDASAAIELLLPTGTPAPPLGTRIHAEGRIGTAYGAARLRADRVGVRGSGSPPAPRVLHGPPDDTDEWRLVTMTGNITGVHKLGERWRAEVRVGSKDLVIAGQPGAGIPSTALIVGRTATVSGIARRPYPNAADRRFAVTPRFPADVRVAGHPVGGAGTGAGAVAPRSGGEAVAPNGTIRAGAGPVETVADADVVDLDAFVGKLVRVGGLVVDLRPDGFSIDDGTAIGRVVVRGAALDLLPMVEPSDALNAIGRVEASADVPLVAVEDPGGIILAGDPVAVVPSPTAGPEASASPSSGPGAGESRFAGLGGPAWPVDAGLAGLGKLIAISALSLAVTLLRRAQARHRLAARVAGRLATFAQPSAGLPEAPGEPSTAEREPSTIHSA